MKATLLGIRSLDFKTSEGEAIVGKQLYISFPDENVQGEIADKLFVRGNFPLPPLKPGMALDITYNRKGKAESITAASNSKINLNQ